MLSKAALGLMGLASTGVISLGIHYSGILNPSTKTVTISSLVEKDDYTVVMQRDDKSWETKWKEYEASANIFKIKNPSQESLKEKCSTLFKNSKVSGKEDKLYASFLTFCTRNKTTKEKLQSLGKSILDKNGKDQEWKTRFGNYKLDTNRNKLANVTSNKTDQDTDFSKLSSGCHELADKAWKETEGSLPDIEKWCLSSIGTGQ
ncbi:hypothetical protein MHC_01650 [Mycoplasma haemocanis str. Illinois]|uniref:Uncharacterized protein n=1 Tax=Mycoplasma haemocanis (strain Illinois) TaxID=1111676 RepID=H6N6C4_MYCHN|nr:hypothetical protein [Mycoplasma haemocanis]AEW45196.1 hypothetical protein MHC_01650 [Mycoplasma haemocanis str. Illinois]